MSDDTIQQPVQVQKKEPLQKRVVFGGMLLVVLFVGGVLSFMVLQNTKKVPDLTSTMPVSPTGETCSKRRYSLDEALQHPAQVCDLQIATDSEFLRLATASSLFTGLQTVYFNKVNATVSAEFAQLTELRVMNFHHTSSTTLPPEIGRLKKLTVLHMSKADIETLPPEIGQLENLTQLIISLNTKQVTIPSEIRNLKKLNVLTLRNNPGIILPELSPEQNIEYIDISDTGTDVVPAMVYRLRRLQTLNMSYNRISNVASEIEQLSQLRELRADNNLLSLFPDIRALKQLETLNLSNNNLTELPKGILTLQHLKYVNLSGNTISPQDIGALMQALPKAQVVY
jgi:Leucine-rich repeat (LRR) protein